jgi:cytochrome b561
MAAPNGYSRFQILLHWGIGLLIIFKLIFGEDMGQAWRSVTRGLAPDVGLMVRAHILVGGAVLALVAWRLGLRLSHGLPALPQTDPTQVKLAAKIGHSAVYALMVLFPITGLLAWSGRVAVMAKVHGWMKPVLMVLIAVHLGAALWHQFWLKDSLLDRMKTPQP